MDAYLAVVSKREVRAYDGRPLAADAVRRILEAGRLAGSSRNRQSRRFVVLDDPVEIDRAAAAVFSPDNVHGASLVVVVLVRGKGPVTFDAGRAAQNMMLAAWSEGIGSCPNGVGNAGPLAELIGHAADEEVAIVLTFGYPARPRDPQARTPQEWIDRADRLPFEDVVEHRHRPVG
jgi:nitroreductase